MPGLEQDEGWEEDDDDQEDHHEDHHHHREGAPREPRGTWGGGVGRPVPLTQCEHRGHVGGLQEYFWSAEGWER